MDANVVDQDGALLMIIEAERMLIPISPSALRVAQSTKRGLRRYEGALVISPDGRVLPIKRIHVVGPWGESMSRRVLSALTGASKIRVDFHEPKPMSLDELKDLLIRYLSYDRERPEPYFAPPVTVDEIREHIRAARDYPQLFDAIGIPPLKDCLDVL